MRRSSVAMARWESLLKSGDISSPRSQDTKAARQPWTAAITIRSKWSRPFVNRAPLRRPVKAAAVAAALAAETEQEPRLVREPAAAADELLVTAVGADAVERLRRQQLLKTSCGPNKISFMS